MSRIKSLYRSWAIPCSGTTVYAPRHRAEWLAKIPQPGVRLRARTVVSATGSTATGAPGSATRPAAREPPTPCREITATNSFDRSDSCRLLVALLQTPHRFRTKRQLWAYSGFAIETHDSGEYRYVRGKLQRNRERITVRGLE